jgi:PadR family transcriptional regulator, regulatory protein AphA
VSLRYAILGYLSTGPGSGYDMSRQFDTGLGWFWSARHSQIYPELKRMAEEGLVARDQTTIGENMEKFTYSITGDGLATLAAWTSSPPSYPPNRDVERLQLIFSDDTPEALREHLVAHRDHYLRRRDQLRETLELIESGRHERINSRLRNRSPASQQLTLGLRVLAYSGDIDRATLEVEWAERALTWLETQQNGAVPQ